MYYNASKISGFPVSASIEGGVTQQLPFHPASKF